MRKLHHPKPQEIALVEVLSALGDPVRLSIVATLAEGGERGWSDLEVPVCGSTLSHHLKVLRLAGVIEGRQEGTRCFVSLRPDIERIFPGLIGAILDAAERKASTPLPGERVPSAARR